MFSIHDIRESRVYQEGVEEGRREGFAKVIAMIAANTKMSAEEIADMMEVDVEFVHQAIASSDRKWPV